MCSKRSEEEGDENMGINEYNSSSEVSPMLNPQQQAWILPQMSIPSIEHHQQQLSYGGGLFNSSSRGLMQRQLGLGTSSDHMRLMGPFGQIMPAAQEIMDAKALAASKSHSEAERRRRERINNHLAKLRTLLPSTTKTDKASLLAEVIDHVRDLKRQTSIIAEQSPVPTETDELTIDNTSDEHGNLVIRASLCCEDRSDLLPDLIKTLKALRLRTLKAEITTLGGRMKNVLFITADEDSKNTDSITTYSISMIQEAFKAVMDKTNIGHDHESSSGITTVKRQRTTNISALDHRRT